MGIVAPHESHPARALGHFLAGLALRSARSASWPTRGLCTLSLDVEVLLLPPPSSLSLKDPTSSNYCAFHLQDWCENTMRFSHRHGMASHCRYDVVILACWECEFKRAISDARVAEHEAIHSWFTLAFSPCIVAILGEPSAAAGCHFPAAFPLPLPLPFFPRAGRVQSHLLPRLRVFHRLRPKSPDRGATEPLHGRGAGLTQPPV